MQVTQIDTRVQSISFSRLVLHFDVCWYILVSQKSHMDSLQAMCAQTTTIIIDWEKHSFIETAM
jgi:hypothetical protein